MPKNRHLVDELADVRFQRKALEERETQLRARVLEEMGDCQTLIGDQFVAYRETQRMRGAIDPARLRKAGIDPVRYRKRGTTFQRIITEPRCSGDE